MADISACAGESERGVCPKRETCYRFTCEKDEVWQSWIETPRFNENGCLLILHKGV